MNCSNLALEPTDLNKTNEKCHRTRPRTKKTRFYIPKKGCWNADGAQIKQTRLFGNLEYMSIGSFRVELHSVATAVFLGRIMVMIRLPVTIGRCLLN